MRAVVASGGSTSLSNPVRVEQTAPRSVSWRHDGFLVAFIRNHICMFTRLFMGYPKREERNKERKRERKERERNP